MDAIGANPPNSERDLTRRLMSRRALLRGVGAAMAGTAATGVLGSLDWASPASGATRRVSRMPLLWHDPAVSFSKLDTEIRASLVSSGTSCVIKAPARLPLLIDPNKGNHLLVTLPLAAQGAPASTAILPLASAPAAGQEVTRVLQFQQPSTGAALNPNLQGVAGTQPKWGAEGPGSIDSVTVASTNGTVWSISAFSSQPTSAPRSLLDTVTGAPAASVAPLSLPGAILEWSAADMLAGTATGATFGPGSPVGSDLSGSGNQLVVNVGDVVTFHKGPLPGTQRLPVGLSAFPYVSASAARAGMGCSFAGGPISAWTILVALSPGDQVAGGVFDQESVFVTRAVNGGNAVTFAVKYGNMGWTWDDLSFNNIFWSPQPFIKGDGAPVPTVIGWSATGLDRQTTPSMIAGSLAAPLAAPTLGEGTTVPPAMIAGIDLPSSFAYTGVVVYATVLTPAQMRAAALRLAYVGYGGTS